MQLTVPDLPALSARLCDDIDARCTGRAVGACLRLDIELRGIVPGVRPTV